MASAQFNLAPRVTISEIDQSYVPAGVLVETFAAIVGPFRKGPMEPTLITTAREFLDIYEADTAWGKHGLSALAYLKRGRRLYVKRVINPTGNVARSAGFAVVNSRFGTSNIPPASYYVPFRYGALLDQPEEGARNVVLVTFSGDFVTGNAIAITTSDGTTTKTSTVNFITDHQTTMNKVVAALHADMNGAGSTMAPAGAHSPASRVLVLTAEENNTLTVTATVTGGASQATATIIGSGNALLQSKVLEFFANNPGQWGNDLGVRFKTYVKATYQEIVITFNADFVEGNTVSFQFFNAYGSRTATIMRPYAGSHLATLNAVAADIGSYFNAPGSVSVIAGTRSIRITPPYPGRNHVDMVSTPPIVTGGATQATSTVANYPAIYFPDNFVLEVFARKNQIAALETFTVSLMPGSKDGFGNSLYIEDVINTQSKYIKVQHNTNNPLARVNLTMSDDGTIWWFTGGHAGNQPTTQMITDGWSAFMDMVTYPRLRLLIDGGSALKTVHDKMVEVASTRKDCIALLDVPVLSQTPQEAVEFRTASGINTSRAAMYVNDLLIYNTLTGKNEYVPVSGYAAAIIAKCMEEGTGINPAGLRNASLIELGVSGVRHNYTQSDLDMLSQAQLNPCVYAAYARGHIISDAWTLQADHSALSWLVNRLNLTAIEEAFADQLPMFLHDRIDERLYHKIRQFGDRILKPMKLGYSINDYKFICEDGVNNFPLDRDNGRVVIDLTLDLGAYGRHIDLRVSPTVNGGTLFEELGS